MVANTPINDKLHPHLGNASEDGRGFVQALVVTYGIDQVQWGIVLSDLHQGTSYLWGS